MIPDKRSKEKLLIVYWLLIVTGVKELSKIGVLLSFSWTAQYPHVQYAHLLIERSGFKP